MSEELKVKRSYAIPENEMVIIKDTNTLLHNIVDSEIKEKDKEIERLNNIIEEYKNANEYHQNIIHELETMKQPNQLYSENVKLRSENKRLNNIIKEAKDYIRSKSIKFTMAYVEDDGRINLPRSDYRIDKLTSKQVKELLEILDKEN